LTEAATHFESGALLVLEPLTADEQFVLPSSATPGTVIRVFNNTPIGGANYQFYDGSTFLSNFGPQQAYSLIRRTSDWIIVPGIVNAFSYSAPPTPAPTTAPDPITGLDGIVNADKTAITYTWDTPTGAPVAIKVYLNDTLQSTGLGAYETTYTWTIAVTPGTYKFGVQPHNLIGESVLVEDTLTIVAAPDDISFLSGSVSDRTITWNWSPPTGDPSAIKVSVNGVTIPELEGNATSYIYVGDAGTSYTVELTPYNAGGDAMTPATNTQTIPGLVAPPAITGLTAIVDVNGPTITWSWDAPTGNLTAIKVFIDTMRLSDLGPAVTSYQHEGTVNETYTIELIATGPGGDSAGTIDTRKLELAPAS
jgi:hypothetical protein